MTTSYVPVNVENFRKVQDQIRREPYAFFMSGFGFDRSGKGDRPDYMEAGTRVSEACGTAACICGWANALDYLEANPGARDVPNICLVNWDNAKSFLGLTEVGAYQVFYADEWPEPFLSRYENARTPEERASAACDYIDFLCEKGVPVDDD